MKLTDAQIAAAAKQAGFTGNNLVVAVAVALAESGGDSEATNHNTNGTTDYGLFQINSVHGSLLQQGDWRNPVDNAKMAMTVYKGSGWKAWYTYKTIDGRMGPYAKFQGRAIIASGMAGTTTVPGIENVGLGIPGIDLPDWMKPGIDDIPGLAQIKEMLDKIWGAIQTVIDGVQKLVSFVGELGKGISWLGDSKNWARAGLFVVGIILIGVAINRMTHVGIGAAKVALTVAAPEARAAGVAAKAAGKSAVKATVKKAATNVAKSEAVKKGSELASKVTDSVSSAGKAVAAA
jgi:hypothetical protein